MSGAPISVVEVGPVAIVEIHNPPNNYLSPSLIACLADAFEEVDRQARCRAIVLQSEGKHFCAGADFAGEMAERGAAGRLYREGVRLFETQTPVIAAVQGSAVGGGVGLALVADFRVATPETKFLCNFSTLGFHHGFGLSVTLPRLIGSQKAAELLYSGRAVRGDEAASIGLCDRLAAPEELHEAAVDLASEFAASAPLAVRSIRATLREGLAESVREATEHELSEQTRLRKTEDFREGVKAVAERRRPNFIGR